MFAAIRFPRWLYSVAAVVLLAIVSPALAQSDAERVALAVDALTRLENVNLEANPTLKERVLKVLERTRGTPNFVRLVQHFKIPGQSAGLLDVALAQPAAAESGVEAMRLILSGEDLAPLAQTLAGTNITAATKVAEGLGHTGDKRAVPLLLPVVSNPRHDAALRRQAVRALARTREGAAELIALARAGRLAEELKFTAGMELSGVRWPEIQSEAAKLFPPAQGLNAQPLPSPAELIRMKGDAAKGEAVFFRASPGCGNCHVVKGRGADLGPNLTEIGGKLGKDALLESILEPSAGISFGYEAWNFTLKDGDEAYGVIASETADEVALKAVGGIITRLKKTDIVSRQQSKLSIMPAGLQAGMTAQEMADLLEYLASLKK